ncbi:hypothetical protein [Roseateles sp. P5_E7]
MKPRLVQLMTGALVAMAALTACRKEVPTPLPSPDQAPKPTVQTSYFASSSTAVAWLRS